MPENIYKHKNIDREKVRKLYKDGFSLSAIAREFNVRMFVISRYVCDLQIPVITRKKRTGKIKKASINKIRKMHIKDKIPCAKIAQMYDVSATTIINIIHGVFYRWVEGDIINYDGQIEHISGVTTEKADNTKGNFKTGPKVGSKMNRYGVLIPLAKRYKVSPSTICKWLKKGKISF